jgi:pyruvate-formate lyase-activating enzyme
MSLEQIGFYTLSDQRAANASSTSDLQRCELILTGACNFKCPYCRKVGEHLTWKQAADTVVMWAEQGLRNIRFSGGEPTLWPHLAELVVLARELGIERIAVSTNGSASKARYDLLIDSGVNDFSVSLDACCAEDGDKMAGGVKGSWDVVVSNIAYLAAKTYVTVGVVLTPDNASSINDIIAFADSLGVADIRVIPAAQVSATLDGLGIEQRFLDKYKILAYRVKNIEGGRNVRGLCAGDANRCGLVLDDMAIMGTSHYPCIIYMREGGLPIGEVGPKMRQQREDWFRTWNTHADPICSTNCLDVCTDYNNTFRGLNHAGVRQQPVRLVGMAQGVTTRRIQSSVPNLCNTGKPLDAAPIRSGLVSIGTTTMSAQA